MPGYNHKGGYTKRKDLTGLRFNRFVVLRFSHVGGERGAYWECQCDCGTTKLLSTHSLCRSTRATKSCGCLTEEYYKKLNNRTGDLNPEWKGGITPENRKYYGSKEHSDWRLKIFDRDNHTCQICGKRGGDLHPHHIFKKSEYKQFRSQLWNGTTLCVGCHRKTIGHEDEYINEFLRKNVDNVKTPTSISPRITLDNSIKIEPSKCI